MCAEKLDLAFLPLLDPPDEIVTGIVACEDLVVVTNPSHPLAGRSGVTLRELTAFPFVDFAIGWETRPLIDRAFGNLGLQRRTIFDVTDLETIINLVAYGLGIALLPETIADLHVPRIAFGELAEPAICWELLVAHHRSDSANPANAAAKAFMELLDFF